MFARNQPRLQRTNPTIFHRDSRERREHWSISSIVDVGFTEKYNNLQTVLIILTILLGPIFGGPEIVYEPDKTFYPPPTPLARFSF